jgi:hypothetical protein
LVVGRSSGIEERHGSQLGQRDALKAPGHEVGRLRMNSDDIIMMDTIGSPESLYTRTTTRSEAAIG